MDSSFPGGIYGIPNIYVDNFTEVNAKIQLYFLSHVHSDHYQGLWNNWQTIQKYNKSIYMTETSKKILMAKSEYSSMRNIHTLETNINYNFGPDQEYKSETEFVVTLIEVKHMPGAVMFLFRVNKHKILYTGDFIVDEDDELNKLYKNFKTEDGQIDLVYYDATFCEGSKLPTRKDSVIAAANAIQDFLENKKMTVHLIGKYQYGYEDLLTGICMKLNEQGVEAKVQITDSQQFDIYKELYGDNMMTNRYSNIIFKTNKETNDERNSSSGIIQINLYAKNWRGISILTQVTNNKYWLCYPTHCSNTKMKMFLEKIESRYEVPFAINLSGNFEGTLD